MTSSLKRPSRPGTLRRKQRRRLHPLAGVPKERIPYVLRMCDTEGIDLDAADAQDKLDAAVAKVLEAVPELCGGAGTGSTGNFARRSVNAEDALDAKIRENIMGAY